MPAEDRNAPQDLRGLAHDTLRAFLGIYHERRIRTAAPGAEPGEWLNVYPPRTEDAEACGGYTPLSGVDLDRPMAAHLGILRYGRRGRTYRRFRFMAFDLDAKTVSAAQVAADAELLTAALRAEGIEPVPADSGPTGGVHLWTGCAETVDPNTVYRINAAAKRLCPSLDPSPLGNVKDGLVRPPGAAHRSGGYSTLTRHTPAEAAHLLGAGSAPAEAFERLAVRLETLAAALPTPEPGPDQTPPQLPPGAPPQTGADPYGHDGRRVPPSIAARGPRVRPVVRDAAGCPRLDMPWRPLSARTLRSLHRSPRRREDHSALKHAAARGMAMSGWTQAEGLMAVRDQQATPALEWLRSERQSDGSRRPRSAQETETLWERVWWLAVEDASRMPRRPEDDGRQVTESDEVRTAVADLFARMQAAGAARWLRQSGPADCAVLLALAWLMLTSGSVDISANIRRVGVLAGYSGQTAAQALWRLHRDGWILFTEEAQRRAGKARRVTLATSHECPEHDLHRCAVYAVSPVHTGSDRTGTPPPPARPGFSAPPSPAAVWDALTHYQAGLWHDLGHHAARTLWTLKALRTATLPRLVEATGYRPLTVLKHMSRLQSLQLVTARSRRRGETVYAATSRSLYEAGQETGSADRTAHLATTARIDQAQHEWWAAEEEFCSLPHDERPARVAPDQTVIPGMDPRGRAYPRDEDGRADHARARQIEAQRINATGLLARARELARTGALIDPAHLTPTAEATRSTAGPLGRRAAIASRYSCPHCHARPGDRCVIPSAAGDRPAARWHAARRRRAQAQADDVQAGR
ncbi:hypothetical protein ACIRBY_37215 [Streptomyces sp. NPDC096136]|uniref:zinc finger domain-containing protein n=1 Tax=Streptomyces sp. NPDC096136 TaxID=3366076 RepID=UPI003804EE56